MLLSFNVTGPDNKVTIVNLLTKIGKLYDILPNNKTLVDIIGNFIPNINNINTISNNSEFISISQSLNYIHQVLNIEGIFKLPINNTLSNVLGDFTTNYNSTNTVTSKIKNIENYIENTLGFITNIEDFTTSIITTNNSLYNIIGDVSQYITINNPLIKDKYYPLYSRNKTTNLYQAYNECLTFINNKKSLITTIISKSVLTNDDLNYLNDILNNLTVGIITNNNFSLNQEINNTITDIFVKVTNVDGVNYYMFYDSNGNNIPNLLLINGFTYKFDQSDPSNILYPMGLSTIVNGTHSLSNKTYLFDTDNIGLFVTALVNLPDVIDLNPDIILYDNITYIFESSIFITKNLTENYNFNKIKIYTDVSLTNEISQLQNITYNNTFSSTSISISFTTILNNNNIYYYGIKIFNKVISGKIILQSTFYTNLVTYIVNGIVYTPQEYALNIGTNIDRYFTFQITNSTPQTIYYFYIDNPAHTQIVGTNDCNTNNGIISITNKQPDTSLPQNIITSLNTITINNWSDNNNHLFFIPYLHSAVSNNYYSKDKIYTNPNGSVYRFNLELYYGTKKIDIITDIKELKNKINDLYNFNNNNLSDLLSLGNVDIIYSNINRTFVDLFGLNPNDLLINNGTIISYLLKIGTQSDINTNIPTTNSFINIIGNLNNYNIINATDTFVDRLNTIGSIKNICNIPTNTRFVDVIGNLSTYNNVNYETLASLLIHTGKLVLGNITLSTIFGNLSNWVSSNQESLYSLLNKIGILNIGNNTLTNIFGNLNTYDTTNNDTLIKIFNKIGILNISTTSNYTLSSVIGNINNFIYDDFITISNKLGIINIGSNTLTNIFDDLSSYSSSNNDTLINIFNKLGIINIGSNTLTNIFGNLSGYSSSNNDTLINIFNKLGIINIDSNTLTNIFGNLGGYSSSSNDTLINIFNKLGIINIGSNTLTNIFGNLSGYSSNNDTLINIFNKLGIINIGSNTLTNIFGNLGSYSSSNNDTLINIFNKLGIINIGSNTLTNIFGNLSGYSSSNDTLINIFNKLGIINVGNNTLTNIFGDLSNYNNNNQESLSSLLSKIGILNIGSIDSIGHYGEGNCNFGNIVGDFSYWYNSYDTIANVIKKIGILQLNNNTLSNILGNFNSNFTDTIANVVSVIGLSTLITSYLPSTKSNLISLIGNASSFINDTISQRLIDLGTHSDMLNNLPSNLSLINTLGNFSTNNAYDSNRTVVKRLEYLIGNTTDGIDTLYQNLPKIGTSNIVDRSIIQLLGNFNNLNYGYISSSKTIVDSIHNIETTLGSLSTTNISTLVNNLIIFENNTNNILGNLLQCIPTNGNLSGLIGNMTNTTDNIQNRLTNVENNKLINTIFGAFSIEGYYPLYFTEAEAIKASGGGIISFPNSINGPYLKDPITQIPNLNIPSWNVIPNNIILYMPVSANITQYIPTTTTSYLNSTLNINNLTTYPLPKTIEMILFEINSLQNVVGSNSPILNNINTSLTTLETNIGSLTNIISTNLPTLSNVIGNNYNGPLSINSRLNNIENSFGLSPTGNGIIITRYSQTLNNLNFILGDMTNTVVPVNDRLIALENYLNNVSSILPTTLNTLPLLIGNMSNQTTSIQNRLINIESGLISGILWQQYCTLTDINNLNETMVQSGWVYSVNNDLYIVINNTNGDYKPSNWLLKSFNKIINNTELMQLLTTVTNAGQSNANAIIIETSRATNAEQVNATAIITETGRATNAENTINNNITNIQNITNTIGNLQLPTNNTLSITLGNLSNDTNSIQTRITLLEEKIGIKLGTTSNFNNDSGLRLPVNKTLSDILGGTDAIYNTSNGNISMIDFNNSNTEPSAPEPSSTPLHDDLMTIMRKLGRLCLGNPNVFSNLKYYNFTLSEILGNLSNYNVNELGDIITRILNAENVILSLNSSINTLNNANIVTTLNNYLDYYISIGNDGSIINSGVLGKNINSNSIVQTAILYNSTRTNSTSNILNNCFITKNNTQWLFNNTANNTSNAITMANVNTSNYLGSGFTIICYLTNFSSTSVSNIFSIVTPCKSRQQTNRITHLIISSTDSSLMLNTYESSTDNTVGGEIISNPPEPNYSYSNSTTNFAFTDNNPISSNTNATWFVAVTFSGHFSDDYIINTTYNETIENKGGIQMFYKRDDFNQLNKTNKWIPSFEEGVNNQTQGGLSRFFDDYSWIIFGGKAINPQGKLSTLNYFTLSDYNNSNIENSSSMVSSNCNVGEMSLFSRVLTNDEIKELSQLTPQQYIARFRK